MNSHMALCIAEPGEGFFADKAGEALAEPSSLLIHNEAALQCSFDSLSIIIFDLSLSVVFTWIFILLISLFGILSFVFIKPLSAGGRIFHNSSWHDYVYVLLTWKGLIICLDFKRSVGWEFSHVLSVDIFLWTIVWTFFFLSLVNVSVDRACILFNLVMLALARTTSCLRNYLFFLLILLLIFLKLDPHWHHFPHEVFIRYLCSFFFAQVSHIDSRTRPRHA